MTVALHLIASAYGAAIAELAKPKPKSGKLERLFIPTESPPEVTLRSPIVAPVVSDVRGGTGGYPGRFVPHNLPGDWGGIWRRK